MVWVRILVWVWFVGAGMGAGVGEGVGEGLGAAGGAGVGRLWEEVSQKKGG